MVPGGMFREINVCVSWRDTDGLFGGCEVDRKIEDRDRASRAFRLLQFSQVFSSLTEEAATVD